MGICHKSTPVKCTLILMAFVGIILILRDGKLKHQEYSSSKLSHSNHYSNAPKTIPRIYIVTPTYSRPAQMADLTRMAQTLMLVPEIEWIVVEDANTTSARVGDLLQRTEMSCVHLASPTPKNRKALKYGRGVTARRMALQWIRDNVQNGVLYFGDDDNSYDIRIFEEMRWTKKVSVWPVGLIWKLGVSSPVVRKGHVVAFHDNFSKRTFSVDMAGFAVNIALLLEKPNANMNYRLGHLEDDFLKALDVTLDDLEPMAMNCTQVMVWHTRTQPASKVTTKNMKMVKNVRETNIPQLYANLLT